MASKYILSRDQFLINESTFANPALEFLNEIGADLMEMLDKIQPVLPESVSDEFIENSQKYSSELESAGFTEESKLEHILYAMGTSGVTLFTESNFKIESVLDQYYSVNEDFFDSLRSIWNALTEDGSPSGIIHLLLDILGLFDIPIVPPLTAGMVFDGLNAIMYLFEGQYGSALISTIAAVIPGIGDLAKTIKLGKGFSKINKIAEVAFKTGKADKGLVKALAKESPDTLSKFMEIMKVAKPVASMFVAIAKAVGRFFEAILRTWPVSIVFGGLGKKLGAWLDSAITPITKNLDSAIDDINLISKGSDDITAAIKAGDASKVVDANAGLITKLGDELTAAKAAGNTAEVTRLEGILQTRIEKGLPGAGQFVKNGRLIDVLDANVKIADDLLKKDAKTIEKALSAGYDDYVKAWTEVKQVKGVPVTAEDIVKLKEMKPLWIEGRKAEMLFAGVKKLDDIPAEDLVRLTGNAAEIATTKGAHFSARLITEISEDPAKLSKFFNGILANPKTLAKLEEAGPGVVGMYRLLAKNPEVYVDIAKSGQAAIKHFDDIAKIGGKWSQSIRAARVFRNKLIILKNLIGAPMRCPIADLGQGNVGGLEALLMKFSPGALPKNESYKFILSRPKFLMEQDAAEPIDAKENSVSSELDQQLNDLKAKPTGKRNAVLGPLSYVDVCKSHINKIADDLALTASFPPSDSALAKAGPRETFAAAGASSEASIRNQEEVDGTLAAVGISPVISSAGMLVKLPADATPIEVAEARIEEDITYGGLWYLLGAITVNDVSYADVKSDVKKSLSSYETNYKRTVGNTITTGAISFYPSPYEADRIKRELAKLDKNPTYTPDFFGMGVTKEDLLKMMY
jgi:hypothetical protein